MKRLTLGVLLLLFLSVWGRSQECTSKVQGFLDHSGYAIKVLTPCQSWMATDVLSVPKGDGLSGVMLFAEGDDFVIVGTVIRTKAKLNLSSDLLDKLMHFNDDLTFVKVGIDRKGDLFIREELRADTVTAEQFKDSVKRIIAGSNKVYATLSE
ncbi:hypothetical protein Acid345_0254 [Candidatus Koribacter versatilis Ellin345]|uniref:YbjN domain-containing protein n=1 Tax=Koribacter versatilis (strain Ellin345) TaxID=204669 RepID=Q1IV41_KORVE|nr:YbjN domain-containing protein [Candidatus Koribacter versatilis]ABF39259.1 hypothetical protein Acid345_0254 [Candidatus Koribacter versatilis Ellin345]